MQPELLESANLGSHVSGLWLAERDGMEKKMETTI